MKTFTKILFIPIFVFLSGCGVSHQLRSQQAQHFQPVRIAILRGVGEFTLQVKGPYQVLNFDSKETLGQEKFLKAKKVVPTKDGIQIGEKHYLKDKIKISPQKEASVYINNRRFRGEIDIIKNVNNHLLVVNVIDLENYIKGVLYHEISDRWPLEAIKAQAIAARTYALYSMQNSKSPFYDVRSDIYSQVYGGRTSEKYRTNIAVERTAGLVLVYRDKILPAFYHATCAGHTENVAALWDNNLPPLRGVVCNFCKKSPHYSWKKNMRLKDIQDKLNEKGYAFGRITHMQVLDRNPSGRITTIKITTDDDKQTIVSGKEFRDIVGPNVIRSNNYVIDMKGYYVDFLGRGWGHGVGLCQWGAYFMSREGYSYDEILSFYYPGARIVDCYEKHKRLDL
ncbi:MAG: SpoIID/LytB domain-containing protein [Candidatus Aceula meridiana]|nr:SpoIID/LytB domain-containing protein [Candidatus Aceula meridiana]